MFNKVNTLARFVPRLRNVRCMGHGVPAHFKPIRQVLHEHKATMDFMPVPSGSWQESYNTRNAQNNTLLMVTAGLTLVTYAILWQTGCIYFHGPPPAYKKRCACVTTE